MTSERFAGFLDIMGLSDMVNILKNLNIAVHRIDF